jgi:pilus assembly protein CpaE
MSAVTIRAVVAVDSEVDRQLVQAALPQEESIDFVGALDVYEGSWSMLEDTKADVVLVACSTNAEQVPAFIEGAVRQRPTRPVIVLVAGAPNGDVRRIFEAGADDIVTLSPTTTTEDVRFALEKAVARRSGAGYAQGSSLGRMISVLGPKGGCGKTLTSCNLAVALAEAGHSVALVDLDLQFGDVGLTLGLEPRRTAFDLAKSGGSLDPDKLGAYLETHPTGVRVLLGPVRPEQARAITPEILRDVYSILRGTSDYVVVDTPPRLDGEVVQAIDLASDLCMVGMLDALSLKTTKLALETLDRMGQDARRVRLVLNRADSRVGITPADAATILTRAPDVLVPSHRDVAVSVNEGMPLVASSPRSEAAKAFKTLARMYQSESPSRSTARKPARTAGKRSGLLRLARAERA